MNLTSKEELVKPLIQEQNKAKSPLDEHLERVEKGLQEGLEFGEAKFWLTFDSPDEELLEQINDKLTEAGYNFTYDYQEFKEGYNNPWARVTYNIPLGERKPSLCYGCDSELEMLDFQSRYQLHNVLWLGFFGGYGMFFDDLGMPRCENPQLKAEAEAVLCHECAHKLFDTFPKFKDKVFDPYGGHSCEDDPRNN